MNILYGVILYLLSSILSMITYIIDENYYAIFQTLLGCVWALLFYHLYKKGE